MSCISFILQKLGLRPYRDADVDEAIMENFRHDAKILERAAQQVSLSAGRWASSNLKLRESMRSSRVTAFADMEALVHRGRRRRAHRHH